MRRIRQAVVACVFAMGVCGCGASRGLPAARTERYGHAEGAYDLLLKYEAQSTMPARAESAASASELRALWRRWHVPVAPPEVDFEHEVVWAFTLPVESEQAFALKSLELRGEREVWPIYELEGRRETGARNRVVVFVLRLERQQLPRRPSLVWGLGETVEVEMAGALREPSSPRTYAEKPNDALAPRAQGPWLGTLPLPDHGDVAAGALDDGSAVWVVRHREGGVSVLAGHEVLDALAARRFTGLVGLQLPVRYRPDVRRFYGVGSYDEYGASVDGVLRAPLPRHRVRVEGNRVHVGPRETRWRPRGIARSPRALQAGVEPMVLPCASEEAPLSLASALLLARGRRVRIDASLVLRADAPPRLCASSTLATECDASSSAAIRDLELVADARVAPRDDAPLVLHGPLSARVTTGGFVEVRLPPSASYEVLRRPSRPWSKHEGCPRPEEGAP